MLDDSLKTILILCANPVIPNRAALNLGGEIRDIDQALRMSRSRDCFRLEQRWAVRHRDIRQAILTCEPEPYIVHFSGHGNGEEGLVLEDSEGKVNLVSTKALVGLFGLCKEHVECVVLNACYSVVQAKAIAQHIPYVIGMKWAIGDQAAQEFSVGFYEALGAGKSIEDAFEWGCNAISLADLKEEGNPQLFKQEGWLKDSCSKISERHDTQVVSREKSEIMDITTTELEIRLKGDVKAIQAQILSILGALAKIAADDTISLASIKEGSVILALRGTDEGLVRIQEYFKATEQAIICGFSIQDVKLLRQIPLEQEQERLANLLVYQCRVKGYISITCDQILPIIKQASQRNYESVMAALTLILHPLEQHYQAAKNTQKGNKAFPATQDEELAYDMAKIIVSFYGFDSSDVNME
jgi:hypothetical protein